MSSRRWSAASPPRRAGSSFANFESEQSFESRRNPLADATRNGAARLGEPAPQGSRSNRVRDSYAARGGRDAESPANVAALEAAASKAGDFSQTPTARIGDRMYTAARREQGRRGEIRDRREDESRLAPTRGGFLGCGACWPRAELGMVAIDTETTTLDQMQATLWRGFLACRSPPNLKTATCRPRPWVGGRARREACFAGNLAPDQIPE